MSPIIVESSFPNKGETVCFIEDSESSCRLYRGAMDCPDPHRVRFVASGSEPAIRRPHSDLTIPHWVALKIPWSHWNEALKL